MKKNIQFNKINSNVEIVIENKNTEIIFDIMVYNNKLLYFEFVECNEEHVFYLSIKINSEEIFLGKTALIDFDGQIEYNNELIGSIELCKLYDFIKRENKFHININNLLFNGDIGNSEILINAYVFEEKMNQLNLIDSDVIKKIAQISLQDYYFNKE